MKAQREGAECSQGSRDRRRGVRRRGFAADPAWAMNQAAVRHAPLTVCVLSPWLGGWSGHDCENQECRAGEDRHGEVRWGLTAGRDGGTAESCGPGSPEACRGFAAPYRVRVAR